jgi:hypothetical protein
MTDYTPHMTETELYEAAYQMEVMGGGFASAIALAFYRADGHNRKRLLYAFGDLFERFAPTETTTEGESK